MDLRAAGEFARTPAQRRDEHLSWLRPDRAFFASGACHVLTWACRRASPELDVEINAMVRPGDPQVFHVFASVDEWAFDHCGWHRIAELEHVNAVFEGCAVESVRIASTFEVFCREHRHRPLSAFWSDPTARANRYVERLPGPGHRTESCHPGTDGRGVRSEGA
ncbi:hypothetical protein GCM10011519_21250 [Marmoricola endophyticus]|uniref:Uncharacterized protein n=1 Tax=Marmoricola endophyticus TaxID=2040280 RepID=A0A917F477_9ACTN|nr:hypothetical protein [Marmoricola endophyticus]GGF46989.1 hypothetical protein GCM10011519_21250 [Marmoricola endophyticus]